MRPTSQTPWASTVQEAAEEMGHTVEVLARTYAHVIAEYRGQGPIEPEALIKPARARTKAPPQPPQARLPTAGTPQADGGTRTPDPIITSDVLYQLSYVEECAWCRKVDESTPSA